METVLSERLKVLRQNKRLSIRYVAKKLNVSASTYRAWETGGQIRGEPYIHLAQIFDISLTQLLTGRVSAIEDELVAMEKCIHAIRSKL